MSTIYKIVASCRSETTSDAIKSALADVPGARLELRNGALQDVLQDIKSGRRIDLMILDVDITKDAGLTELTEIIDQSPANFPVIATSEQASVDRVRLLMRLGLADFVPQPIIEQDLVNSITVARRNFKRASRPGRDGSGKVIGVIRASGGMGATTLAVNAAHVLASDASKPRRVALVDLDLQRGNVALYLDVASTVGVVDCLDEPQKIDSAMIESVTYPHEAGFDVLTAANEIVPFDTIAPLALETLLDTMRDSYDVLVIDMPPVWTYWSESVLAACDVLLVVTQSTVAAIRQTRRLLDNLEEFDRLGLTTKIICNRYDKKLFGRGVKMKDAENALGRKIDATIPEDFELVSDSQNAGVPLSMFKRGTQVEKAIRKIVDGVVEEVMSDPLASRAVN